MINKCDNTNIATKYYVYVTDTAHKNYCANLFTESFQNNKKQFWSYVYKQDTKVSFWCIIPYCKW